MVIENAIANKESVRLAVNPSELGRERLRAAVRARRPEWRRLGLGRFGGVPENLGAGSVIELHRLRLVAGDLEQAERGHPDLFAGRFRHLEAQPNVALPSEMINLCRLNFGKNPAHGGAVRQIAVMEKERLAVNVFVVAQMLDARPKEVARSPNDSVDRVAFSQEQLGKIRTVLSSNAGNQRSFFHRSFET